MTTAATTTALALLALVGQPLPRLADPATLAHPDRPPMVVRTDRACQPAGAALAAAALASLVSGAGGWLLAGRSTNLSAPEKWFCRVTGEEAGEHVA